MHLLPLLVLAATHGPVREAPRADDRPPNIVLIVVDDLGWSDVACVGTTEYYETPQIDRLAAEGLRFTQAYAACAVCSPSRAALLTGRNPARLGVTDWIHHDSAGAKRALEIGEHLHGFDPPRDRPLLTPINRAWLDSGELTLAELLKPAGYASAHVGKWHLGPSGHLPTDQGFDHNLGGFEVGQPPSYFDPFANKRFPGGIVGLPPEEPGQYLTDREARECVAFIEANRSRPFFLYYAPYAVHAPLQAPAELTKKYAGKAGAGRRQPVYAAMVERVDAAVGAILRTLEKHDLARNTLVVFTSDNGGATHFPATENAPLRRGKGFPTEGGLRVPFIVRWPGRVSPGRVVNDVPVIGTDLVPTLAAAVGVELPGDRVYDGTNLTPLLVGGPMPAKRPLVWHFPHYWWGTHVTPYSVLREGDWKLVYQYASGTAELYDLAADPGEGRDLAQQQPERVARMTRDLWRELARMKALLPASNSEAGSPAPQPPPLPELQRR
jgi:arylsulfatase A